MTGHWIEKIPLRNTSWLAKKSSLYHQCFLAKVLQTVLKHSIYSTKRLNLSFKLVILIQKRSKHQIKPEVWHWASRPVFWEWPCDPSYITGTLPHRSKPQTHRKWSLSQGQRWKAEWLRKRLVAPSDYSGEKTPPTVPLYLDNRPVVSLRTQTKTTLCLSSCSPHSFLCIRALISSVVGQQVSLTQRYPSLCLSFHLSLHPQPLSSLYCLHNPEDTKLAD